MRRSPWDSLSLSSLLTLILCILIFSTFVFAATPDRITGPVVAEQFVKLPAGVPLKAQPEYDQGIVESSFHLGNIMLLTAPSASQQKALNQLLADQQDKSSPLYHKWLTPEQYGERFGLSPNDIAKITTWLTSQGFTVLKVANGRNWISFSGTAQQVQDAMQTEIHRYYVDGEMRFSNSTPASIPAALSGVVVGFRGLNDFHPKPANLINRMRPAYNDSLYGQLLAPGDLSTIYDVNSLYTAGYDGTGQTIAVIGQTDVYLADLVDFRAGFGLPAITGCTADVTTGVLTACNSTYFKYIVATPDTDPGVPLDGDLVEADLDIEYSGAMAKGAQIIYVNSPVNGVFNAVTYVIDNATSPVMTMSYDATEIDEANFGNLTADEAQLQQANSEGITFVNSSGDDGVADGDRGLALAIHGLSVAWPASSPSVTAVGGTAVPYTDLTSTYWNTTNGTYGGTAKGYVPEQGWNDDDELAQWCTVHTTSSFCISYGASALTVQQHIKIGAVTGGGVSACVQVNTSTGACTAGYPKPTWQMVTLTGQTPARFVPDIALAASGNFPGYIICTSQDQLGGTTTASSCASGITTTIETWGSIVGGTSAAAPVFAGMLAIMNQYLNGTATTGLGNINPTLYSLAAVTQTSTGSNGFNHVITGDNNIYCTAGTPSTQPVALRCPAGGVFGYQASNHDATNYYNLVTGLGSIDLANLAIAWAETLATSTTTTVASNLNPAQLGASVTFTATVTPTGSHPPTGTVTFKDGTTSIGTGTLNGSQVATLTTSALTVGSHSITAVYGGDTDNTASTSSTLTQVINGDTTTTTVASSLNPANQGVSVTFTSTVGTAGAHPPTGTVTFKDNGTSIGTGTLNGSLVATLTTSTLTIGTHPITAVYGGDSFNSGSTSSTLNQVIAAVTTTTTVATSKTPVTSPSPVTFTSAVARSIAGTPAPTGTVTFKDGSTSIGTGTLNGSQVATLTISTLTVGSHSITAVYAGDAFNSGSTSSTLTQVINAPAFSLSTPSAPVNVLAGGFANSTFTVTPTGGDTTFAANVTFAACTLPAGIVGVSCTYSPTQIAAGAGATPVTLKIQTSGPNPNTLGGNYRHRADNRSPWLPLALPLAGIVMVGLAGRKISKYSAIAGLCLSLVLLGLLIACGSSSHPVAVTVSPSGATMYANYSTDSWPNQGVTFTPTVTNNTNTTVTWAVTTTNGGSITSAGVYTAPTIAAGLPASATITATSQADTSKVATATVTLTPTTVPTAIVGSPYSITVTATEGPTSNTTSAIALTVN